MSNKFLGDAYAACLGITLEEPLPENYEERVVTSFLTSK